MTDRFDDLSRAIARPHSRRGVLKMLVGAAAGATAATVLRPFRAEAACPPGVSTCGPGCCQQGETCSDPATVCCCLAGNTPCGTSCCAPGVTCADQAAGVCGCPSGKTPCGSGANLTCCAGGKGCGDASCQPLSTFTSNTVKKCDPTCPSTVLFTDDFLQETASDCRTTLAKWNLGPNGNVDVVASWSGSSGQVVDLDGSPNICGGDGVPPVSLKTPITVLAGRTYRATFKLSTNPSPFLPGGQGFRSANNPDINKVSVKFGPVSAKYTKQPSDSTSFTTESLSFIAGANGTAQLVFQMVGPSDRGGIILDKVDITESCP